MTGGGKHDQVLDALSDSDFFGALEMDELEKLVTYGTTLSFKPGQTVFQKGDPGDSLMVVLEGRVKIGTVTTEGRETLLNFIDAGQSFGEMALIDGKARSADAVAAVKSELFALHRSDLLAYIEGNPSVAVRMVGVLCARVRRLTEMIEDAMVLGMPQRIARALLRLAGDYGTSTPGGVRIELKLSQRELGSYVGLARENVNRQLGVWRQSGVLTIDHGAITIHDFETLKDTARLAVS